MTRDDRELAALLRDLPDELPPEHDLWPEIRDRIEPPRARRSALLPLAAGGVLLLALASAHSGRDAPFAHPAPAWEAEVAAAADQLAAELDAAPLSVDQRAAVDARMREIRAALDEIRAVAGSPAGP